MIRIDAKSQSDTVITPEKFATLCRELDLGARYQRHIDEALALPAKPVKGAPVDDRASAADIRRLKVLDMQVALHMAYLKKHITQAACTMLLSAIEQDAPALQKHLLNYRLTSVAARSGANSSRQHHGKQFNDPTAPFHVRMETAAENAPTFGVDYLTEVGSIAAEQNRAENALLKRLTEAAMQADASKTCFALD